MYGEKRKPKHKLMRVKQSRVNKPYKIIGKGRFLCHKELTYNEKMFHYSA